MNAIADKISKIVDGKRVIVKKPELLAPAGNLEKLKIAVHYGADAVFIGGQEYGLRSNAGNFTFEEMKEGVEFAKKYGAKVYVTTNIFAHNENIDGLDEYLEGLQEAGVHGIIVADPLIIETCKRVAPNVEIHLSTQQSLSNWKAVQYWKEEGLERVVLARETSADEIREMKEKVDIEIEAFVHGAMCIAYSGRCTLSNHMTARDSNRGGCCQSCRWDYDLYELDQDGEKALFDKEDAPFAMSPKDLKLIESLPGMIEIGIDSLKVEGRMKSIHYIATVVSVYRKVIDAYCADPDNFKIKQEWLEELDKCANRETASSFMEGEIPGYKQQ
ncbi:peptidase U32 family protein, partial [Peribacillus simplex]